jgi:nitric-oxide synthase, bacterial
VQGRRQGHCKTGIKAGQAGWCRGSGQEIADGPGGAHGEGDVVLRQDRILPEARRRARGRYRGERWPEPESAAGSESAAAAAPGGWSAPYPDAGGLDRLIEAAERFITLFHNENRAGRPDRRLREVRREIEATATYRHTRAELAFGARAAWRNSARCTGRRYWRRLRVRDRREVSSAPDIAAESAAHLREATNGGRIRPVITVFAPDAPARPGPRILNAQLVRYAGYECADGRVLGDPANADITRVARALGWSAGRPPGRFDVLPLLVQEPGALASRHDLPADAVLEVMITHPEFGWFAGLGLRWYAVPVISDMYLDVGGVRYPAAPFNGWYTCTEIGSRFLGDEVRYDQLPAIAGHLGLSTAGPRTLWRDRAITELNLAVLHSFTAAGVTICDHHAETVRLLRHLGREERPGRACPADGTWIVPPAASSPAPVLHRCHEDFEQSPNFSRHPAPSRVSELFHGQPPAGLPPRHLPQRRYDRPSLADAPVLGVPKCRFLE